MTAHRDGWVPLEVGERHTCVCGTVTVGRIGPRGGKTWLWAVAGEQRCSKDCAEARDLHAMDMAQGEYEADLGEAMYGGDL